MVSVGLSVPDKRTGGCSYEIRVAGEAPRGWDEGELFILDDSFEHELWASGPGAGDHPENGGQAQCQSENGPGFHGGLARLILIADVPHPDLAQ